MKNGWTPDVGNCEWSQYNNDLYVEITVHAVSDLMAIISERDNEQFAIYICQHSFRKIKTEAERRRDEQIEKLADAIGPIYSPTNQTALSAKLIDAGWIKPKPLTEGVIEDIVKNKLKETHVTVNDLRIAKAIESYILGEA